MMIFESSKKKAYRNTSIIRSVSNDTILVGITENRSEATLVAAIGDFEAPFAGHSEAFRVPDVRREPFSVFAGASAEFLKIP